MAENKSLKEYFRENLDKDVMLGEGEDGKLVTFPPSELEARIKERDRIENMSDDEFREYLDGMEKQENA